MCACAIVAQTGRSRLGTVSDLGCAFDPTYWKMSLNFFLIWGDDFSR